MGEYQGKYQQPPKRQTEGLFLFIIGLVVCSCMLQIRTMIPNTRKLTLPFGRGSAIVLSDSMYPTFKKGDLVFLKDPIEIDIGDVVVYERDDSLVVHRIIELREDSVITQGDANAVPDEPFPRSQVRAVVVGKFPGVGKIAQMIQTPAGTLAVIFVPIMCIEVSLMQDRRAMKRSKQEILTDIQFMREETNRILSKMEEYKR